MADLKEVNNSAEVDDIPEFAKETPLLNQILSEMRIDKKSEKQYDENKEYIKDLIRLLLQSGEGKDEVSAKKVDEMISSIDEMLSLQMDAILHDPKFQKLESTWRSLKFLVEEIDSPENTKIEILNITEDELRTDFEISMAFTKSKLYDIAYTKEYGTFGGEPYTAMIGNYEFGYKDSDISLLKNFANIGAMAHAPFIAGVRPDMFGEGMTDFTNISNLRDLKSIFSGNQYIDWRELREEDHSRYLGLALPRFLLRLPYVQESVFVNRFQYEEDVSQSHEDYLWGNAAFAFATRLIDSFAKHGWCTNIIGPQGGGALWNLHTHKYESMGEIQIKPPTELEISGKREVELSEEGFIPLTWRRHSNNAAFFSANSLLKPKRFPDTKEGREAQTNFKLSTQLPYMFIVNRLAHYTKVYQMENIGTWKERGDLERELNKWIQQYVANQENPSTSIKNRRPLKKAQISVKDVPGDPGWYGVQIDVTPWYKYMGAYFTLSLVGKLDKGEEK